MATRHIKFWRYYKEWVETYKLGRVRKVTYNKYLAVGRQLKEEYEDLYLDEITRATLQRMVNKYGETHEYKTVQDWIHHLQAPLRDAVYEKWIKKDPTYKVLATSQKEHKEKQKWLESLDDVEQLVRVFRKHDTPDTIMFDFTLRTGLRFAEVLGLTPKDVDQKNLTIYVNKTMNYKDPTNLSFQPTKNKYSMRVIKIDWQAMTDLQKVMVGCPEDTSIFWKALTSDDPRHRRVFNSTLNKKLKKLCEEANVYPITIHGLRHTHASILISQGVSIQSVAKRLGHGDTTTTQQVYIHLLDDLKVKDDNKMMSVLSSL